VLEKEHDRNENAAKVLHKQEYRTDATQNRMQNEDGGGSEGATEQGCRIRAQREANDKRTRRKKRKLRRRES